MTELVVGTKKGLFLLEGEADGGSADRFEISTRAFAGQPWTTRCATRTAGASSQL